MIERETFVVFGDDWNRRVSTLQHLFHCILRDHTVIWVNGIGHRSPKLRWADLRRGWQKLRARRGPAPHAGAGWTRHPQAILEPNVLPWHGSRAVQAWNARILERDIRAAVARVGSGRPPILVTGSPPSVVVLGRLGERLSLYLCMDDFLGYPGVDAAMIGPLEERLLAGVDALVATSRALVEGKRVRSGRAYRLSQGVNYDHFATPQPRPAELDALPRPIIGMAGSVNDGTNLALLQAVAEAHGAASVVVVGPVWADVSPLGAPNVHLLGARPYGELPGYVQAFDVAIVPYVVNDWTRAIDPLKLLEYLAAGCPVVTTDLPEADKYREVVRIARGVEEFVQAVGRAIHDTQPDARVARQAVARRHRWEGRAARLLEIVAAVDEAVASPPAFAVAE